MSFIILTNLLLCFITIMATVTGFNIFDGNDDLIADCIVLILGIICFLALTEVYSMIQDVEIKHILLPTTLRYN